MKITLLGDSIRLQYESKVKELLGTDFEVWGPADNCRFAKYTLRGMFDWAAQMEGAEIVHWNNGHWDICNLFGDGSFSSEEEYIANMLRIVALLQKKHKVIIFSTTTPVRSTNPHSNNQIIAHYNELIVPKLREKGVIINDLYGLVATDIDKYIRKDDNIHLTEDGAKVCAKQVARMIREAAEG